MQNVFLRAMIVGNLVHPISLMRVCNRITPIEMAPPPYVNRSQILLYLEMAATLVLMDVQGQIKYLKIHLSSFYILSMSLMPMHPIPSHFLSENVFVYESENVHDSLLQ